MKKGHALLSASSSKRWLACPPSARLEEQLPEEKSAYAQEGTLAHKLAEAHISHYLGHIDKNQFREETHSIEQNPMYSQDMPQNIQSYLDLAMERINAAWAKTKDAVILLEQKLDFSPWVPEGFGTGDLVIITDSTLEIIDLKYGQGVTVDAKDNSQLSLYALGAIHQFGCLYDLSLVKMTICQPRREHLSTEEMTVEDLLNWGETFVKPRAQMAMEGEGEFQAGEHCRFCRARFTCRARAEEDLKLARFDFKEPELLTDEEIPEILQKAEQLKTWVFDIYDYALSQAVNEGKKWTGFKLVEGRSIRKYTDEETVAKILLNAGYSEEQIYAKTLLGIQAMEKAVGKRNFHELLGDLVIKPPGKPALVPESDKRPEINRMDYAIKDFEEGDV